MAIGYLARLSGRKEDVVLGALVDELVGGIARPADPRAPRTDPQGTQCLSR
ncbi:hypothetical protein MPS_3651 [Mycobacterium pseudoshottsii JCM 15466]|nr:hypothetical protein MMSP_4314 [Mycobacterium sp. 012931]EPQ75636.1 hypothetical protein MMMB2_0296 [Mycobacterium marinum MB2]EPQ79501.1 hypothetical protein MMEU_0025 [Mycobacterium marinum str. Europe]MBC9864962.1 hypothetical protein [Mycobacterium pseudoshottsii]GAQ37351.1 hypothetical protein MPS_3651 [Mycobacterium pseudoshottsii JCM 15466]